jgi:hypothetical protein
MARNRLKRDDVSWQIPARVLEQMSRLGGRWVITTVSWTKGAGDCARDASKPGARRASEWLRRTKQTP